MWGLPGGNGSLWERIDVLLHQGPTFLFSFSVSLSVSLSLSASVCVSVCVSLCFPHPTPTHFSECKIQCDQASFWPSASWYTEMWVRSSFTFVGPYPPPPWWTVTSKWAKIKPSCRKLFRWIFVTSIKEKQLMQLIWRIHPLMANFLSYSPLSGHLTAQHEATGFISTSNQKEQE